MLTILSVGKKHDPLIAPAILDYQKRLRAPFDIKWVLIAHSASEGLAARHDESERIILTLKQSDYVILLDERGTELTSPAFSRHLQTCFNTGKPVVLIIGGAFGVSDTLRTRANLVWSLSSLVFPHQLVRLILTEQLYRAQSIALGSKYHHE